MPLDLHVTSSGGSTALGAIATIPANDGATVAGVPIAPSAVLTYWGGLVTVADTIKELKMTSQDQWDPINGEDYAPGASSLMGAYVKSTWLPYRTGQRQIAVTQNTAASNSLAFTLDLAAGQSPVPNKVVSKHAANQISLSTTFGGALTAVVYGSQAFAPTTPIPNGYYALIGANVSALTNYGLIRFKHADFGLYSPGFPVLDQTNTTVANAVLPKDEMFLHQGYQFSYFSQVLGQPCNPVFRVTNAGTGLTFQAIAITADTPVVQVNIVKIADLSNTIS